MFHSVLLLRCMLNLHSISFKSSNSISELIGLPMIMLKTYPLIEAHPSHGGHVQSNKKASVDISLSEESTLSQFCRNITICKCYKIKIIQNSKIH